MCEVRAKMWGMIHNQNWHLRTILIFVHGANKFEHKEYVRTVVCTSLMCSLDLKTFTSQIASVPIGNCKS